MRSIRTRLAAWATLVACLVALAGCKFIRSADGPTPMPSGVHPDSLIDADQDEKSKDFFEAGGTFKSLEELGLRVQKQKVDKLREIEKETGVQSERYNSLLISGGAVYGAYSAGVLCGWSDADKKPEDGGRPQFSVVTGISTGAIIAPYAFLGKSSDADLRRVYTTITTKDVFERRRGIRGILSESAVDNAPLRRRVDQEVTFEMMALIAAEHDKRRRLYIGTTNLDTRRLVVWDIGEICKKGRPQDRQLIVDIILASAAIPAVFPSVRFNVEIDGQPFEELHVDGGVTRSLFYRSPTLEPSRVNASDPDLLFAGSNVFVLVAGKMYLDPDGVRARTIAVAGASISSLLYAETRAELYRIYTLCILTGMNFWVSAIPPDLPVPKAGTNFDPVEMGRMFEEGYRLGRHGAFSPGPMNTLKPGPAWDTVPPELRTSEMTRARTGLQLKVKKPADEKPALGPPAAGGAP